MQTDTQIDFSVAYETMQRMVAGVYAAIPRLLVAVVVFLVLYYTGSAIRRLLFRKQWNGRRNLEIVTRRLFHATVIAISILVAASIVFPSITASSLIQLLGISGIAVGFAFKDIFQNFLAGILLLVTEPFAIGDQISVAGFEGTVEDIQTRATLITTYDNRRVVVPNAELFTKSVTVNTAFRLARMEYDFVLPATIDLAATRRAIVDRVREVYGVADDPLPDIPLVKFDANTVTLRVRWWCSPKRSVSVAVQDRVLQAVREVTARG
jgi:small-conductance mechanosensitive channel